MEAWYSFQGAWGPFTIRALSQFIYSQKNFSAVRPFPARSLLTTFEERHAADMHNVNRKAWSWPNRLRRIHLKVALRLRKPGDTKPTEVRYP